MSRNAIVPKVGTVQLEGLSATRLRNDELDELGEYGGPVTVSVADNLLVFRAVVLEVVFDELPS